MLWCLSRNRKKITNGTEFRKRLMINEKILFFRGDISIQWGKVRLLNKLLLDQ